jgi:hypothetical protein
MMASAAKTCLRKSRTVMNVRGCDEVNSNTFVTKIPKQLSLQKLFFHSMLTPNAIIVHISSYTFMGNKYFCTFRIRVFVSRTPVITNEAHEETRSFP